MQAEGAAYAIYDYWDLDTSGSSFGYVAGWAGDKQRIRRNLAEASRIASTIIKGTEKEAAKYLDIPTQDAQPFMVQAQR